MTIEQLENKYHMDIPYWKTETLQYILENMEVVVRVDERGQSLLVGHILNYDGLGCA